MKWTAGLLSVAAVATALVMLGRVASEIENQSTREEAREADAIVVLGAAEYSGRPSPVLQARLNHALFLYLKGLAPRIITTGGSGGDPVFTEGAVARRYLSRRGVPAEDIIVENEASNTAQSAFAVGEIMERMGLSSAIVVSDGYHIFRVKKMLEAHGIRVYGSPRPSPLRAGWRQKWLYFRQAVGYALWQIGIAI